jgi:hypothetical protein
MSEDEATRKARAQALRQRSAELTGKEEPANDSAQQADPNSETEHVTETPREFVERRMRELDPERNRKED